MRNPNRNGCNWSMRAWPVSHSHPQRPRLSTWALGSSPRLSEGSSNPKPTLCILLVFCTVFGGFPNTVTVV